MHTQTTPTTQATPQTTRRLLMPALASGALMAAYLLIRPYGDHSGGHEQAAALASPLWVVAHVCGLLALAQVARVALRLHDVARTGLTAAARSTGLVGAVLVAPYYGAETFGLHAIGTRGLTDPTVLSLVAEVRNQPVALAAFGLGLLALGASGILVALAWQRRATTLRWAAWPLGAGVALVLPQFYLPPVGRMAFGVAYATAAAVFALAVGRERD